jgi:type II secretory pathway pseudopilin PulG
MKLKSGGYTILEVMLFLAITAGMFGIAMRGFSGRQATVQFSQAVNDMSQIFASTANDVKDGFSGERNITCTSTGGSISIASGASITGQNSGCAFIGKVLVVAPESSGSQNYKLHIFTVVAPSGVGLSADKTAALQLSTVGVKVVHADSTAPNRNGIESGVSFTDTRDLPWGIKHLNNASSSFAVGYLNGLGEYGYRTLAMDFNNNTLKTAALTGNKNSIAAALEEAISSADASIKAQILTPVQADRKVICFVSPSGTQSAKLRLGGNGGTLAVETEFDGDCRV